MRKRGMEDWIRQVEAVFLKTKDGEAHSNQLIKTTQDIVDKSGGGENSICEITSGDLAGVSTLAAIGQAWVFYRDDMPGIFPKRSKLEQSDN